MTGTTIGVAPALFVKVSEARLSQRSNQESREVACCACLCYEEAWIAINNSGSTCYAGSLDLPHGKAGLFIPARRYRIACR